ncbi:MAG: glycosyl hydrolase [Phycisphaeraceae bacterium]|nr:MAG: glycosyl hydrolase [Phycisphaeraceae bacterium]
MRSAFGVPITCLGLLALAASRAPGQVTWISSTADEPWREMNAPAFVAADPATPPEIRIAPGRTFQSIDGFGGAFNELGWQALNHLSASNRDQVMQALFGDDGCAFNLGRIPIGASDFGIDWCSADDTPGDVALEHFSIDRDSQYLIPYVQAAMAVRPGLSCWASPWSPPAWMKANNNYSGGSLRWEPEILGSYATYLARWVEEYRAIGIDIFGLSPQNEPNTSNVYPTCTWTGPQLREFIAGYLGPTLQARGTGLELWLSLNGDPPNGGDLINGRLVNVLDDPAANGFLTGVAYQYDSRNQIASASKLYPDKRFMQSETVCHGGANSWSEAQQLFALMKQYFEGGANSYFMWNMVLDETGLSTWNWRQNAMVTVDRGSHTTRLNGEYYVMRHFSRFVRPGARRALMTGEWGDQIGFVNPDGSLVLVIGNSLDWGYDVRVCVGGREGGDTLVVTLPGRSINTFVVDHPVIPDACNGADLAEPLGSLDFFDVLKYLDVFDSGCS